MTQEQWLIYLYSIWPDGGFRVTYTVLLIFITVFSAMAFLSYLDDQKYYDKYPDKSLWLKFKAIYKTTMAVLLTLVILSSLIPDKKTFLLLVATPSIQTSLVDSNGKLHKINSIIDKALTKADKLLEDK